MINDWPMMWFITTHVLLGTIWAIVHTEYRRCNNTFGSCWHLIVNATPVTGMFVYFDLRIFVGAI
jgi:hypothetical protein